jgi:hypothetical protein
MDEMDSSLRGNVAKSDVLRHSKGNNGEQQGNKTSTKCGSDHY